MGKCLRELRIEDAEYMLEWMVDQETAQMFQFDTTNVGIEKVLDFINDSACDKLSRHFAIVDRKDEYMGTISLKGIDEYAKKAEYAIVLRKCARGTGLSRKATDEILALAFNELGLSRVFLNVFSSNSHAIEFYHDFGFTYEGEFRNHIYAKGKIHSIQWFSMMKEEYVRRFGEC